MSQKREKSKNEIELEKELESAYETKQFLS